MLYIILSCLGTISVVYLIVLVTIKAAHLGFHLEFHWFDSTEFYVPGKLRYLLILTYSNHWLSFNKISIHVIFY